MGRTNLSATSVLYYVFPCIANWLRFCYCCFLFMMRYPMSWFRESRSSLFCACFYCTMYRYERRELCNCIIEVSGVDIVIFVVIQ